LLFPKSKLMTLNRSTKLSINTIVSLINQLTIIICGFVLPRMFLVSYGSAVNGLQASITQFLGFIALCELGVGAVVKSTLYKPLAQKNEEEISKIFCSSERFFRKLGWILLFYTVALMLLYPFLAKNEFSFLYTTSLILIISLSAFARYFLGMTYRLLLSADQLDFIPIGLHIIALILNTIVCVILMKCGFGIHLVKLISAIIYIAQPICLAIYVHKHYKINHKLKLISEPIKQKWNGLAQHLASFVLNGTPIAILTIFTSLKEVSIYTVYNLVTTGIKQFVMALTTGTQATFGNMLANNETENLNKAFTKFEWIMHTLTTLTFGLTGILIIPFVKIYTNGITDVNYIVPLFAYLFTIGFALHSIRLPYNTIILAAEHYKQTQNSAIIEMSINLTLSIVLVFNYGLIGIAVGMLVALAYRTIYFAWYLSKNIMNRNLKYFIKHIFVDVLIVLLMLITGYFQMKEVSYFAWFVLALKTSAVCVIISFIINLIFYRFEMFSVFQWINKKYFGKLKFI